MDIWTAIGAIIAAATAVGSAIGVFVKIGEFKRSQQANTDEINELKVRVDKAEDAATRVGGLATAVEHMGQRLAGEIGHLIERMNLNNDHVKAQLDDLKEEVRFVRNGSRPRGRAGDS